MSGFALGNTRRGITPGADPLSSKKRAQKAASKQAALRRSHPHRSSTAATEHSPSSKRVRHTRPNKTLKSLLKAIMQHQLEPAFETLKKPTSSKEDINAAYIHLQASYVNAEVLGEKASDELFSKLQESFELLNTHSRARHIVGFIDHITSSDRCPIETDICQNLISKDSSLLDALKLELKRAPSHRAQTALKPIIESHETQ